MRSLFLSSLAVAAFLSFSSPAFADESADRSAAIQLCRDEVSRQAGVEADAVRFDQVRTRSRAFRVELDLWRDGQLTNVRCDVARGEPQTIAAITPALQTATAAAN